MSFSRVLTSTKEQQMSKPERCELCDNPMESYHEVCNQCGCTREDAALTVMEEAGLEPIIGNRVFSVETTPEKDFDPFKKTLDIMRDTGYFG
jgi:hypothetical protein